MSTDRAEVDALLPLPPATFHILLALVDQERHGYAIIQDVEARTDGELRMSAGTLYRSIARMVEQGLISEVMKRASKQDDQRRRYYRVTPFGTAVARAEMRRYRVRLLLAEPHERRGRWILRAQDADVRQRQVGVGNHGKPDRGENGEAARDRLDPLHLLQRRSKARSASSRRVTFSSLDPEPMRPMRQIFPASGPSPAPISMP